MKAKFIGAILCVVLLAACPFIAVVSEGDAPEDASGTAARTIVLENLNKTYAEDIFENKDATNPKNIATHIYECVYGSLGLNEGLLTLSNSNKATIDLNSFNYSAGMEMINTSDTKIVMSFFEEISLNFKMVITNDGYYIATDTNGYEGEAVTKMLSKYYYRSDNPIEISGSLSMSMMGTTTYTDLFTNSSGALFAKSVETVLGGKEVHELDLKIGTDSVIHDSYNVTAYGTTYTKYDIVYGTEGEHYSKKPQLCTETTVKEVNSSGSKTIDGTVYKYRDAEKSGTYEAEPSMQEGPTQLSTSVIAYYYLLPLFNHVNEYIGNDSAIEEKVAKYNGVTSKDQSTYESGLNNVTSQLKFTVTIRFIVNDFRYGTLSTDTIVVDKGAKIVTDGNTLKVGDKTVFAYPADSRDGQNYSLKTWGVQSDTTADSDMTIIVEFQQTEKSDDMTLYNVIIAILIILVVLLSAYIIYSRRA